MNEQTVLHKYNINFITDTKNFVSTEELTLSVGFPYFDAHFGNINEHAKVGQTYYLRPFSEYNYDEHELTMWINCKSPVVHLNNNKVTDDVSFCGNIKLTHVFIKKEQHSHKTKTYYALVPHSKMTVNLTVINNTGLPLQGLHVHEGERGPNTLTGFGPICYFLWDTQYWRKEVPKYGAVPYNNAIAKTDFVLKNSNKVLQNYTQY